VPGILEPLILLPQLPEGWDYRHAPLCLAIKLLFKSVLLSATVILTNPDQCSVLVAWKLQS
jgi:hypothetical protein